MIKSRCPICQATLNVRLKENISTHSCDKFKSSHIYIETYIKNILSVEVILDNNFIKINYLDKTTTFFNFNKINNIITIKKCLEFNFEDPEQTNIKLSRVFEIFNSV